MRYVAALTSPKILLFRYRRWDTISGGDALTPLQLECRKILALIVPSK